MRRRLLTRLGLVCVLLVTFGFTLWAQEERENFQGHDVAAREVLVKFKAGTSLGTVLLTQLAEDIDVARGVGGRKALLLRSRSKNVATLLRNLSQRPEVEYAEPNYIVHAISEPNDPSYGQLWGLRKIGAPAAWDVSTDSSANVVAVVDTGVDYTHPDLAANVWSAPHEFTVTIGDVTITCPAGSHGFNAIRNTCDPMDDNNHGTHVSGTIGAVGDNGIGVVGVNWKASIMGAKFLGAGGSGTTADAVNAIEFAIQAKQIFGTAANVRVLSNSWGGGGFSETLLSEIKDANTSGMLFVAAAGNEGSDCDTTPHYPSSYVADNVISVAATDSSDNLASWSNYGATTVDLAAPGVSILSTIRRGRYDYYSGTSMATPHVSGAAALVLSVCSLDTAALKSNILDNVDPVPSLAEKTVKGGRLNVDKAIGACSGSPTDLAAPTGLTATAGDAQVALTWSAVSGATSYNVKRSTTTGASYATVGTASTGSYVDHNLANGTTYYYVVSAVKGSSESPNSGEVSATPTAPTVPTAPTRLTATAGPGARKISLAWAASSGATSYNVKRSAASGGSYTTVATGVTATRYVDGGLTSKQTYYYVVIAVNSAGESGDSNVAYARAK